MLQHRPDLDLVFKALADPSRRAMLSRLCTAPASMSELAEPFDMSLSAIGQHLKVLAEAGLVDSEKAGRVRTFQVKTDALAEAEAWLHDRRGVWEQRLDGLGDYLAAQGTDP